jgi:putative peptidoglycan lipid II flippase
LAIAGIAIGTVLLPNLSKHIQSKNKIKINFIQNKSLELCLFLSLPATAALLIASEEITSSLFGYGSFNSLSVKNSSIALFYFALGLPAFSIIKIFSSFLFARNNTKTPFYFSVFSVVLNIIISVYFFNKIGFVIIPIATTISSWFNAILLFIYLINKKYFSLEMNLLMSLLKITFSTVLTSFAFSSLIKFFSDNLTYEGEYKLVTIIFLVILTFIIYILISLVTKAFKISDINLKY